MHLQEKHTSSAEKLREYPTLIFAVFLFALFWNNPSACCLICAIKTYKINPTWTILHKTNTWFCCVCCFVVVQNVLSVAFTLGYSPNRQLPTHIKIRNVLIKLKYCNIKEVPFWMFYIILHWILNFTVVYVYFCCIKGVTKSRELIGPALNMTLKTSIL